MSDARITQLTALSTVPTADDLYVIVDVHDSTQAASGTTKSVRADIAVGVWTKETPTGALDGVNLTYTLAHAPRSKTLDLAVNGQLFTEGVDYTVSSTTLTLSTALPAGFTASLFIAKYLY